MSVLFWGSLLLVAYSYLIYPVLLAVLVRLMPAERHHQSASRSGAEPLPVACVVAAFNEERHIGGRIENLLAQTYDADKLKIYVGSDGSRDRTGDVIQAQAAERVEAFVFPGNRGKASVVNDLVAASSEPILVFSDANTVFERDAVERMVARFDDPHVGVVCGELKLVGRDGSNQDSAYWRMEQYLKRNEARLGGLLGANGAIYAMRRELYRPLPPDTITDDFCIAMSAAAEGWKLAYEPRARAVEETPEGIAEEYQRRVRIGIGNYQALFRHPEYLLSTSLATRFAYISHKVLRWLTPHLLLAALLVSALLAPDEPFWLAAFVAQVAVYGAAAVVLLTGREARMPRVLAGLLLFLAVNWAFLVASIRYATGHYNGSWRTARQGAAMSPSSSV